MPGSSETLTVCEPGRLEEEVMLGKMVIGVNAYREVGAITCQPANCHLASWLHLAPPGTCA